MAKSRRHTQDRFQSAEIVRLVVIAGKGIAVFLTLTDFVDKEENEETSALLTKFFDFFITFEGERLE